MAFRCSSAVFASVALLANAQDGVVVVPPFLRSTAVSEQKLTCDGSTKCDRSNIPAGCDMQGLECGSLLKDCEVVSKAELCERKEIADGDKTLKCSELDNDAGYDPKGMGWPLYLSYAVGVLMALGIGGNDSANSLATAVGSGAMGLTNACIMGAIGEWLGATFLGAGVSGTIRRGVAEVEAPECWACGWCNSRMDEYQFGMIAALWGAAFFLLLVTFFALPVSTTHAVVGGVVGMTVAVVGWPCLNWGISDGLGKVALGWVLSPLAAGAAGMFMYVLTYYPIMKASDPKGRAIMSVPIMYGASFSIMLLLVLMKSTATKSLDDWVKYVIAGVTLPIVTILARIFLMPGILQEMDVAEMEYSQKLAEAASNVATPRRAGESFVSRKSQIFESLKQGSRATTQRLSRASIREMQPIDAMEAAEGEGLGLQIFTPAPPNKQQSLAKVAFRNLLNMTAFLACFGHGANDTANATGPLTAVQFAYDEGIYACGGASAPIWLTSLAGVFVGIGVITMGYRVIKTVGEDLSDIDFQIGFCVEFASALSVVLATLLELPVSTTHCKISAVVFVAMIAYGPKSVAWGMFGKIGISWLATLPASGGMAWLVTSIFLWAQKS